MIKKIRTFYWSSFKLKAFQLHYKKNKQWARNHMGKQLTFFVLKVLLICCSSPLTWAHSDIDIQAMKEFAETVGTHGILLTFL